MKLEESGLFGGAIARKADAPHPSPSVSDSPSLPLTAILFVVSLSSLMEAIDANIVSVALPRMAVDLSAGVSLLSWIITAYLIASAASVLQSGKMGDIFGRRRIFLIGFALFGVSSALAGFSASVYEVIVFRVIQGVSATMSVASGYPLIFDNFPAKRVGMAIGINSAAWSVGAAAGPVFGGFLVAINWRFIFFVNVPIAILGVLVGAKSIPRGRQHYQYTSSGVRISALNILNLPSSIMLALTVTATLMWLTFFNFIYLVPALLGGIGFFVAEKMSASPLINRTLLKSKGFVYTLIGAAALTTIGASNLFFGMSFYLETVVRLSPELAGLLIAPLPIALVLSNTIAGRLYNRLKSPALLSFVGMIGNALALVGVYLVINHADSIGPSSVWYLSALCAVAGIGGGFWWTPMFTAVLRFAKPELAGIANGTASMLVYVGFAASIALLTIVSASFLSPAVASQIFLGNMAGITGAEADLFGRGIALGMLASAGVIAISLPFFLLIAREERRTTTTTTTTTPTAMTTTTAAIATTAAKTTNTAPSDPE